MKHTTISLLALVLFTSPSLSGEYGNCHGCSTVTVTSTITTGNRAIDHTLDQANGNCNWVGCVVGNGFQMLRGSGPDPTTRVHTRTIEVCEPKKTETPA